jgi:hypothetical protein
MDDKTTALKGNRGDVEGGHNTTPTRPAILQSEHCHGKANEYPALAH